MGPAGSNIVIVKCINTNDSCFKSKGPIVILTGQIVILWQYLIHIAAPGPKSDDLQMETRISTEDAFSKVLKKQKWWSELGISGLVHLKKPLASPFDLRNAVQLPDAWTR